MNIQKVAVLGSGVMGSGIAALIANAGVPVVLLDIVLPGKDDRSALTKAAIEKQLAAKPPGFTHRNKAKLVTPGNLEDNLDLLKDVDWIIEVVLEKLEVKQDVYRKIDAVRKKGSVVSSNTSTLPLHVLTHGMPDSFAADFMITHFFNPPRFMRLLEMVPGEKTRKDAYADIRRFADIRLGKGVVDCKDTPGFIANRIGVFWMMVGLLEAMRLGIPVEAADAVMGRPLGIPKTGIFGLFDLIGIDLMPLIAKAMLATLPANDPFRALYKEPELVKKMIADGYTGRKGKGGFYRINKDGGKKVKEVLDLKTGEYHPEQKPDLESLAAAKGKNGFAALMTHPDIGGQYARAVMGKTLAYAASLIPEISDDIVSVDNTMKWGYSWKMGPFEMIDKLGGANVVKALEAEKFPVPPLLVKSGSKPLYQVADNRRAYLNVNGDYVPLPQTEGVWSLADKKLGAKPVARNGSAALWDLGDGIACLELTSKMNSIDPDILGMAEKSIELVKQNFKGLVIGSDADNFSAGANLGFILYAANMAAWPMISDIIRQGQRTMMALKYAPFPVVSALSGMALGGGCEFVLHSDAVQAHIESYPGLVEVGVGVIPGWGGCKEMLLRNLEGLPQGGAMPAIAKVFETIATAKVAGSADEARDMKILHNGCRITMNRARLLPDAKALCLTLAESYSAPQPATVSLPGLTAKTALLMALDQFAAQGKATPHDVVVCTQLAGVLSGGDTDITDTITEQQILDLEHAAFMELVRSKGTLARIEYMLANGKPLRN
jgi:3-hydroxyacyl-CoA dehydrogenase